ncbi:GATA zinc finger protein [Rhizoctonia solani AG-3 Rhs1AP]|uniref:GATA zinc finger protein n=1 Tax=Rhizoctonia solani AG-3 Rhs1AP TaxID=1086054 RepID=A0A0A1UL51_9AGAM|nr:GATA zinc finger protein [Rhizoctonia solani AG-3 Rhs1AP]
MAPTLNELPGEYSGQTPPLSSSSSHHHPREGELSDTYQLPTNPSSSQHRPYSDTYQTPTNPSSPQHHVQQLGYPSQPPYYAPYNQPTTQRNTVQMPYSYQPYSPMSGPSTAQLNQAPYPASPYVGNYGVQSQPVLSSHRVDSFYYTQSTPSPTTPTITEGSYGHHYMPFRQARIGLSYPDAGQPSSAQLPTALEIPQHPVSSDQKIAGHQARGEEVKYDSLATNYRRIISTVSQASPSPTADSPGRSFETPVVEDMLHQAVEGLRYLNPTKAEQYVPSGFGAQPVASGAVASEGSSETVFVRYYEDGRTEVNPTKKKKRERKGTTQCASCHVTSTPEWRRGPLGPRTLCNACGLVYAKLMKKRAKEEEKLSPESSSLRARSKGKSRELTEESEEDREQGSDDTSSPMAGPSGMSGGAYPP